MIIIMALLFAIALSLAVLLLKPYNILQIGYDDNDNKLDIELADSEYEPIIPDKEISCEYYDIAQEYRNAYGNAAIDALIGNCDAIGGVMTETNSELSCYWMAGSGTIDCDSTVSVRFESFCENTLLADFTCDNSIAYYGCQCEERLPSTWLPPEPDPDYDWSENETYEPVTFCFDVELPQYGDLGGICRADGYCDQEDNTCEHYWDYTNQIHKCGCSDMTFCGQYCYEYYYTTECACPPNSYREIVTRSTFRCVPDGCTCSGEGQGTSYVEC